MESENKALKNWFSRDAAERLGQQVAGAWKDFDQALFVRRASRGLSRLEFNGRVKQFSDALRAGLPEDVPHALEILTASLPQLLPDCEAVTDGYLQWPLGQFIADLGTEHLDESMQAMVELTQRFSAEFAVRPFVELYPDEIFKRLLELTSHPSPHVRRWCSEGVRSRLPWGKRLQFLCQDPTPIWPILEALYQDEELYVRRSVANNLNDISRDHPEQVINCCRRWGHSGNPQTDWVIKHGLRTLLKAGDPAALATTGYKKPTNIAAELAVKPARAAIGSSLELTAKLSSTHKRKQKLMVDYLVHYVKKNGSTSGKVFKWKTLELPAGDEIVLQKKHSLRLTSVRTLHPGEHKLEVQVNGHKLAAGKFYLKATRNPA